MKLVIKGKTVELKEGAGLPEVLDIMGNPVIDDMHTVIINGKIIPQSKHSEIVLKDGDEIGVFQLATGG